MPASWWTASRSRQAPWGQGYGHLAILPYPVRNEREWQLRGGGTYRVRPIRPADGQMLQDLVEHLSPESRYFRFVSRYISSPDQSSCEFSLVVADDCAGRGLGSRLMEGFIDVARDKGLAEIEGLVLTQNADLVRLNEAARLQHQALRRRPRLPAGQPRSLTGAGDSGAVGDRPPVELLASAHVVYLPDTVT